MPIRVLVLLVSAFLGFATFSVEAQESNLTAETTPWLTGLGLFGDGEARSRSSKSESSSYMVDLRVAHAITDGFYGGVIYAMENQTVKTSGYSVSADNHKNTYDRQSFGPTFGYVGTYVYGFASYHTSSSWTVKSVGTDASTKDVYSGSGFQLDFGLILPLGPISLGPQLSYKSFEYKKLTSQGSSSGAISPSFKDSKFDPYLALWMAF